MGTKVTSEGSSYLFEVSINLQTVSAETGEEAMNVARGIVALLSTSHQRQAILAGSNSHISFGGAMPKTKLYRSLNAQGKLSMQSNTMMLLKAYALK